MNKHDLTMHLAGTLELTLRDALPDQDLVGKPGGESAHDHRVLQ